MGITKNHQSEETILRMAQAAFGDKGAPAIRELTEGMCNAAYELTCPDGFRTVLKIASGSRDGYMTNESRLMESEVTAMRTVVERSGVKVAEVYRYDTSKELCNGDYFFMEALDGTSWISVADTLTAEEASRLHAQTGRLHRQLANIKGDRFGIVGDHENRFDSLHEFLRFLIGNVLDDAERKGVVIGVDSSDILAALERDRDVFAAVTVPTLVHWDMWEGNIFIKDGRVTGIIDWERAMWGEAFMDDRFRSHNQHPEFLRGFGMSGFSPEEQRRIYWYDILLYLTMMTEVFYREYEDDGQYQWSKQMFEQTWRCLA